MHLWRKKKSFKNIIASPLFFLSCSQRKFDANSDKFWIPAREAKVCEPDPEWVAPRNPVGTGEGFGFGMRRCDDYFECGYDYALHQWRGCLYVDKGSMGDPTGFGYC